LLLRSTGPIQRRPGRGTAIAAESRNACASDGRRSRSVRGHLHHQVPEPFGEIEIILPVDGQALDIRYADGRGRWREVIQRGNNAAGRNLADEITKNIRDIEIAFG